MTAHAAELGRVMHGAAIATLQSSAMGFSVYERMGYRTVTDWQVLDATVRLNRRTTRPTAQKARDQHLLSRAGEI